MILFDYKSIYLLYFLMYTIIKGGANMEHRYKLDYKEISKRVKNSRKVAKLTQAELAEKINISTNAVAKLETNLMTASLQTLINIANVLDLDINYLLFGESKNNNEPTNADIFLTNQIQKLSQKDKDFIIHIINGLKIYSNK